MFECREQHPDLVESMAKKGSNVPEKPKTPQQLWYNHEKKAFLKTHPDVSLSIGKKHAKCVVFNCICVVVPTSIFLYRHQATTKDIKDSLGKQWTQLSDKKRLKWIAKSLEQRKQYEVGAGTGAVEEFGTLMIGCLLSFLEHFFFPLLYSRWRCVSTSNSIQS